MDCGVREGMGWNVGRIFRNGNNLPAIAIVHIDRSDRKELK